MLIGPIDKRKTFLIAFKALELVFNAQMRNLKVFLKNILDFQLGNTFKGLLIHFDA